MLKPFQKPRKRKRWCAVREVIVVIRQRRRDGGEGGGEGAVERLMSYPYQSWTYLTWKIKKWVMQKFIWFLPDPGQGPGPGPGLGQGPEGPSPGGRGGRWRGRGTGPRPLGRAPPGGSTIGKLSILGPTMHYNYLAPTSLKSPNFWISDLSAHWSEKQIKYAYTWKT